MIKRQASPGGRGRGRGVHFLVWEMEWGGVITLSCISRGLGWNPGRVIALCF